MKKLCVAALLALVFGIGFSVPRASAQEAKDKPAKAKSESQARWHGTIVRINSDVSTLTVRKGNVEKIIHYDASTQWTKMAKPAQMSDLKEGDSVICLGKYDDKKQFVATRVDLRTPHMVP